MRDSPLGEDPCRGPSARCDHRGCTVATLLREVTDDLDLIRRWLGQKTLAMAIHYSDTADTSAQMRELVGRLDPLGSKARTKMSNASKKVSKAKSAK